MARKFEDAVEAEVRRRYADLLASAGVNSGRLSLEVLYLLPEEFVREYIELFWEALREDISTGKSGGENPIKKQGEFRKGKLKRDRETGELTPGSARGAQGGGKKYRNHWLIRSEFALEVKQRVDRKLVRMIGITRRDVKRELQEGGRGRANLQRRDSQGRFGSMDKSGM